MYVLYIVFAILIFGFLIGIHEFGHFFTAKLFKIKVNEFAIGMGPAIWKKQKGETLYALRCVPLGGYCAMEGEDEDSDDPRAFGNAAWWKKLVVLVAGAGMNFITGLVLCIVIVSCMNLYSNIVTTTLDTVEPGSSMAGTLQAGDTIWSLDGERVYVKDDVTSLMSMGLSEDPYVHDLVVIRDGEKLLLEDVNMEPRELPLGDGTALRLGLNFRTEDRTVGTALREGWNTCRNHARLVRLSLQMLFRGDVGLKDLSGPVGIVKTIADVGTTSDTPSLGFWNVLTLAAFVAVNLGIMNLLPIPALDGGRVVGVALTAAIEGITRKKLNPKIEGYIHAGGMILLLLLMAVILLKDVIQIFQ